MSLVPIRKAVVFALLLLVGLGAVACGKKGTASPSPTEASMVSPPPAATATEAQPVAPSAMVTVEQALPTATPSALPASPTPKQALEATDPTTVQLASGQVQLIEFFAFW